jgi:hypothetical protein
VIHSLECGPDLFPDRSMRCGQRSALQVSVFTASREFSSARSLHFGFSCSGFGLGSNESVPGIIARSSVGSSEISIFAWYVCGLLQEPIPVYLLSHRIKRFEV